MKINSKSVLIARRKDESNAELPYVVEIKLFDINNPHLTTEAPKKVLEFRAECVEISLPVSYFVRGSDIVLNDAGIISIEQKGAVVTIRKS